MKWSKLNPLYYLRYFPHPEYGHFGGFYNRRATWDSNLTSKDEHQKLYPIDMMDSVFKEHDSGKIGPRGLVFGCLKAKNFKRPVWGQVYRILAVAWFLPGAIVSSK